MPLKHINQNYIATIGELGGHKLFLRCLKLQLLTRSKVIVAGTALISKQGVELFELEPELSAVIGNEALLPAIRNSYGDIATFVESLHSTTLNEVDRKMIKARVPKHLEWSLKDATDLFEKLIVAGLSGEPNALPNLALDIEIANQVMASARAKSASTGWIRPEHVKASAKIWVPTKLDQISAYVDLVYRLSGAHAVRATAVLPNAQYALDYASGHVVATPETESSLFWDAFIAAVHEFDPQAVRLSPEQLDQLSFKTILRIREKLQDKGFWAAYHDVIDRSTLVRGYDEAQALMVDIDKVKGEFLRAIQLELGTDLSDKREQLLFEGATTLVKVADFASSGLISTVTSAGKLLAKSIDVISPSFADKVQRVRQRARAVINGKTQLRQPLLEGYDAIAIRPVNKKG